MGLLGSSRNPWTSHFTSLTFIMSAVSFLLLIAAGSVTWWGCSKDDKLGELETAKKSLEEELAKVQRDLKRKEDALKRSEEQSDAARKRHRIEKSQWGEEQSKGKQKRVDDLIKTNSKDQRVWLKEVREWQAKATESTKWARHFREMVGKLRLHAHDSSHTFDLTAKKLGDMPRTTIVVESGTEEEATHLKRLEGANRFFQFTGENRKSMTVSALVKKIKDRAGIKYELELFAGVYVANDAETSNIQFTNGVVIPNAMTVDGVQKYWRSSSDDKDGCVRHMFWYNLTAEAKRLSRDGR